MYYPQAPLSGGVDESLAGCNLDFSFMQILALFSINVKALTRMIKASW